MEKLLPTPSSQTSVFWNVAGVPVSAVETPDGGLRLGAFDSPAGRPISLALVLKDGFQITEEEFERLKPAPAVAAPLEPKTGSQSRPNADHESLRAATQKRWAAAMAFRIQPSTEKPARAAPEKSSSGSPSVAEIAAAIAKVRVDESQDAKKSRDEKPDAKPERK